jgi:hypothetical protein
MQINHCDLYIKNLEKQTLELACQIILYKKNILVKTVDYILNMSFKGGGG